MEMQGFQKAKAILEKNKYRRLILLDMKTHKGTVIPSKDRQRDPWVRPLEQSSKIDLYLQSQLKDKVVDQMVLQNQYSARRKDKL